MKKIIIILLLFIAVAISVTGNYFVKKQRDKKQENSNQTQSQPEQKTEVKSETQSNVKTYTMEEVVKHGPQSWDNGDSSLACWMVIHDKVYEIPESFTETHPGGHVIYEGCGTDATTLFETRPEGSKTPHSQDARATLEKFYIGDLKK